MARPNRRLRAQVQNLHRSGLLYRGECLHVRTCQTEGSRLLISVRKRFGKAVARNRARRRIRAICRELAPGGFPGRLVFISVGDRSAEAGFQELRKDMRSALQHFNLLSV